MDDIDRAIINGLQEDGRLSNVELAQRIGLSPSPCLRRIRKLETDGVITGYRAVIAPETVDRGFQVIVSINLSPIDRETVEAFEEAVSNVDDVIECHRMFSKPDYILRVAVADLVTYERIYVEKLAVLPSVASISSQMTMKIVKKDGRFSL